MRFQTVGVVGAGTIGRGVAQHLAETDHAVVLVDPSEKALESARAQLSSDVRLAKLYRKGYALGVDEVLGRIAFTTELGSLANAQFVVENIPERWALKKELYPRLDAVCPPACPIAANTSCLPITRLGAASGRPDRVLGMHYMNPVPLKPVVEVIRGRHTSEETLAAAHAFLAQQGKEGIVVKDSPGFVSNRVLMLTVNEAVFLLHEDVARPKDIDRLFTTCFGHKMGPLETADLIGLDTVLLSLEVLHDEFGDSKYRPCPLLRRMVDAGWTGKKSGRGFFTYQG